MGSQGIENQAFTFGQGQRADAFNPSGLSEKAKAGPLRDNVEALASDKIRELHAWWVAHGVDPHGVPRGIPDRSAFDPTRCPHLLPNMIIAEAETDPFRIRYRLVGTRIADVLNIDFTGRYLDQLVDEASHTPWQDYFLDAYLRRRPVMGDVTEATLAGGTFTFEFGIFPVTAGSDAVRQFLCIEDYFDFNLTSAELIPWSIRDEALSQAI